MRKLEAARDFIMRGIGTDEPWVEELGMTAIHWRRPLRVDEINRMAPTPDVKRREGRA
jgi:hypothetical protein